MDWRLMITFIFSCYCRNVWKDFSPFQLVICENASVIYRK